MEYTFSDKISSLQPILKNAAKEGYKVQDLKDITTSVHYVCRTCG